MKCKSMEFYPNTKRELDIMLKIKSKAKFAPGDRYEWSKLLCFVLIDNIFDGRKFCKSMTIKEDKGGRIFCSMTGVNTEGIADDRQT